MHNSRPVKGNVPVHCDQEGKEGHLVEASKSARLTQVHEKPKVAIHQIQHNCFQLDDSLSKLHLSLDLGELRSEQ